MYDRLRQTASDTYSSHNPLVIWNRKKDNCS
jgi:hypothetical protein